MSGFRPTENACTEGQKIHYIFEMTLDCRNYVLEVDICSSRQLISGSYNVTDMGLAVRKPFLSTLR